MLGRVASHRNSSQSLTILWAQAQKFLPKESPCRTTGWHSQAAHIHTCNHMGPAGRHLDQCWPVLYHCLWLAAGTSSKREKDMLYGFFT